MEFIIAKMSSQKIFGLLVSEQKAPIIEKPEEKEQCYLCGFSFKEAEDCMIIFVNEDLTEKKHVHGKCIQNHLRLLSNDAKIALVSIETNEILSYTTVSEKA
ncbi:MAG: hypothetical protein DRP02_10880 [Candidatus Gerdarchaeota archaeon]|nr:MAG: hypothetical protein DRP02_10880 [Candidatus Gerdarchaeota archaeon]